MDGLTDSPRRAAINIDLSGCLKGIEAICDRLKESYNPDPEPVNPLLALACALSKWCSAALAVSDLANGDVFGASMVFFTGKTGAVARSGKATGAVDEAFHYTRREFVELIRKNGLRPGSYVTKKGDLSPLQAQLDLALRPNRGLPGAVIRIDLAGMRKAGYEIGDFTTVGRKYNMPGGGTELEIKRAIPAKFVKVVR